MFWGVLRMRCFHIGTLDFICCWLGMALALQLLLNFYSPLFLLANCGPSAGFPGMVDLATASGMVLGVLFGSRIIRSGPHTARWLALLASSVAMAFVPPIGPVQAIQFADGFPAIHMAVRMTPAMLAGYATTCLVYFIIARGRSVSLRPQLQQRESQL